MVSLVVRVPGSFEVNKDEYGQQTLQVDYIYLAEAIRDLRTILDQLVLIANVRADT